MLLFQNFSNLVSNISIKKSFAKISLILVLIVALSESRAADNLLLGQHYILIHL